MTHTADDMTSDNGELPPGFLKPGMKPVDWNAAERAGPGGVIFVQTSAAKLPPVEMVVFVPGELSHLVPDIKRFVDAMVYKLRKNKAKGKWEAYSITQTLELLKAEVAELAEAIQDGNDLETILEAADIGNFAMIAASIAVEGRKR